MSDQISILTIGSELLDGRVQDTNANFLAAALTDIGLDVSHILSCGDNIPAIVEALRWLSARTSVTIISGGLGPTTDDKTREAVAAYAGVALEPNAAAIEEIRAVFTARKRPFIEQNSRQGYFPSGSVYISNPTGTAPGFSLSVTVEGGKKQRLFTLPGVPSELKVMFSASVLPAVRAELGLNTVPAVRMFRIFGLAEAKIGALIEQAKLPDEITISYRASFPEIQLKLRADSPAVCEAAAEQARAAVGADNVFSDNPAAKLQVVVHELLLKSSLTVAAAESCTGGMLGSLLTENTGSSAYFLGSAVTYSNEAKNKLLGVSAQLIANHGAVSAEVAKAMAHAARSAYGSDMAISITGIAGPDGGTAEKPVGTFFIGLATPEESRSFHYLYISSRDRVRTYAAYTALDLLRRYLLKLPLTHEHLRSSS